jgi:hypothetical protein
LHYCCVFSKQENDAGWGTNIEMGMATAELVNAKVPTSTAIADSRKLVAVILSSI